MLGDKAIQERIFVVNCAHSFLLLEEKLEKNPDLVSGRVTKFSRNFTKLTKIQPYIISNDRPTSIEEWQKMAASLMNYKISTIPLPILWMMAYFVEMCLRFNQNAFQNSPLRLLTPSSMRFAVAHFSFDTSRAKKELGYEPLYSTEESVKVCYEWCKEFL